nr:MAG TPA_asm: hypothetical protein [Caudoviricetes sp.]
MKRIMCTEFILIKNRISLFLSYYYLRTVSF